MVEPIFSGAARIQARAWFVGDRIDVRALERGDVVAVSPLTIRAGAAGCAILFRYGVVVLFEIDPTEEEVFLTTLKPLVLGPFDRPEHDEAEIAIHPDREERVEPTGTVSLHEASSERVRIVAEILAKSAVLTHYEEQVSAVFDRIEPLARSLHESGRGRVPGRELLNRISDVLTIQARTVGRVEVPEKPELTWDRPDLDRLYERLGIEYELRERDLALNRKLELISRTAETCLELLQHRRSLRVEWYIVILILVEIVLILYEIFVA